MLQAAKQVFQQAIPGLLDLNTIEQPTPDSLALLFYKFAQVFWHTRHFGIHNLESLHPRLGRGAPLTRSMRGTGKAFAFIAKLLHCFLCLFGSNIRVSGHSLQLCQLLLECHTIRADALRFAATFGATPLGNRSPPFALGPHTADLLEEFGFEYDSSLFGHDEPYRPRVPTVGGGLRDFVELPVSWELDDAPYFLFNFFPHMSGMATPAQVLEIWKAEFEGSYRAGGCFLLVVHPFCIGRYPRIAMLDELITWIKGFPNVWFGNHLEVAREWRRGQEAAGLWDAPQEL